MKFSRACNFRYIRDFEKLVKITCTRKFNYMPSYNNLVPIARKLYVAKWPKSEIRENVMLRKFHALQ